MSEEFQFYFAPSPPTPPPVPGAGVVDAAPSEQVGGGFGAGPFGSMPFGSGGGLDVADAEQVATNAVRVRLAGNVPAKNRGDVRDALYDRGWLLDAPSDPAAPIPRVIWAERETSETVILYLDAPLAGPGHLYRVIGSAQLVGGDRPVSARSASFRTFGVSGARSARTRANFDLANVAPGTLQIEADGDYKNDAGFESTKKRLMRRLMTPKGRFAHLPDYGLKLPLKRLFTVGDLRTLQADARAQARAEGVDDAEVEASSPELGVLLLRVTGTALGSEGVEVEVRSPD